MKQVFHRVPALLATIIVLFPLILSPVSCIGPVEEDLAAAKEKLSRLKEAADRLNSTLLLVDKTARGMNTDMHVTGSEKLFDEDGKEAGYSLSFKDGTLIRIWFGVQGEDGKDGHTPNLSVRMDEADSLLYWTVDGEWMKDVSGGRVPALGRDGRDGRVDAAPQVKIEGDQWMISYDGGNTWTVLASVSEMAGYQVFIGADDSEEDCLVFTLSDSSALRIPRYVPVSLALESTADSLLIGSGEILEIPFRITGSVSENRVVTSGTDGRYVSAVEMTSLTEGVVRVTCKDAAEGYIFLQVHDGGFSALEEITFLPRTLTIDNLRPYPVAVTGGLLRLPFKANFQLAARVREGSEWVTVAAIRQTNPDRATIDFVFSANDTGAPRSGWVDLVPEDHPGFVCATVEFNQAGPATE